MLVFLSLPLPLSLSLSLSPPSPSVQVWGSDAEGAIHNPPTDVVWRNQGTWGSGSNVVTKLVNKAGEVRLTTNDLDFACVM